MPRSQKRQKVIVGPVSPAQSHASVLVWATIHIVTNGEEFRGENMVNSVSEMDY